MKEIKDDTWTDWLLNNKCSRKLSKRTEWSPLTIITIGTLLSVALFSMHRFLFVIKALFICKYNITIPLPTLLVPFRSSNSCYLH